MEACATQHWLLLLAHVVKKIGGMAKTIHCGVFNLAIHMDLTPKPSWFLHCKKASLRSQGLDPSIQHEELTAHPPFPPAPVVYPHPCDYTLTSKPHQ